MLSVIAALVLFLLILKLFLFALLLAQFAIVHNMNIYLLTFTFPSFLLTPF